jgi:hypothetical protein
MKVSKPAATVGGGPGGMIWGALALALLVAHAWSFGFVVDDAFISYRYAQNLVQGEGLVFNPGEKVEGYSNLSWVLLTALGLKLGLDPLLWARVLGTAAMAGLLLALPSIVRLLLSYNHHAVKPASAAAQLAVAVTGAVACWTWAGLETPLFGLLIVLGWRAALRRDPLCAGVIGLLLVLTRPEGPALAVLLTAWSLWPGGAPAPDQVAAGPRRWLGPAILLAGTLGFFLWRHAYFGFWLPNTYYAKTGDLAGQVRTGLPYGWSFLAAYVLVPGALAAVAAMVARRHGSDMARSPNLLASLGLLLFWWSYTVLVGGDMLGMYRFFVPLLPVWTTTVVVLLSGSNWLTGQPNGRSRWTLVAAGLVAVLLPASFAGKERRLVDIHMSEANLGGWILAGDALADLLPKDATIALGPAGYIPWRTGLRTIDFYGIIDPVIAHRPVTFSHGYAGHEKHDGAYVISRRPDYILIGNVDITDQPRTGLIPPLDREVDIVLDRDFQAGYEQIYLPTGKGRFLNLFRRKDLGRSKQSLQEP